MVSKQIVRRLDECFPLIGEKPSRPTERLQRIIGDWRNELAEIQSAAARKIFVLAKANRLAHLCAGEHVALIAVLTLLDTPQSACFSKPASRTIWHLRNEHASMLRQQIDQKVAAAWLLLDTYHLQCAPEYT